MKNIVFPWKQTLWQTHINERTTPVSNSFAWSMTVHSDSRCHTSKLLGQRATGILLRLHERRSWHLPVPIVCANRSRHPQLDYLLKQRAIPMGFDKTITSGVLQVSWNLRIPIGDSEAIWQKMMKIENPWCTWQRVHFIFCSWYSLNKSLQICLDIYHRKHPWYKIFTRKYEKGCKSTIPFRTILYIYKVIRYNRYGPDGEIGVHGAFTNTPHPYCANAVVIMRQPHRFTLNGRDWANSMYEKCDSLFGEISHFSRDPICRTHNVCFQLFFSGW